VIMFCVAAYLGKSLYSLASFFNLLKFICLRYANISGKITRNKFIHAKISAITFAIIRPAAPPLIRPKPSCVPLDEKLRITWELAVCLKAFDHMHQACSAEFMPAVIMAIIKKIIIQTPLHFIKLYIVEGEIRQNIMHSNPIINVHKHERIKRYIESLLSFWIMIA